MTYDRHRDINQLKHFFYGINFPFHVHGGAEREPDSCHFTGIWLEPNGLHFFQCEPAVSIGRLIHEAGHWALMTESDRSLLRPGCLLLQGIETIGYDTAVEAWTVAVAIKAGIDVENLFSDTEDYGWQDENACLLKLALITRFADAQHTGIRNLETLGMTRDFPNMKKWYADERAIALHKKIEPFELFDLDEDLCEPLCLPSSKFNG